MDQSDIFRLLLLILLLSNDEQCDCRGGVGGLFSGGLCSINQIIILMLLLNPPRVGVVSTTRETTEGGTTF
ncbi:MAG: hypothetical protein FWE84_02225 [Firmicutes bacterium]|nr:hypothetical protein [Bacillota bacterium]